MQEDGRHLEEEEHSTVVTVVRVNRVTVDNKRKEAMNDEWRVQVVGRNNEVVEEITCRDTADHAEHVSLVIGVHNSWCVGNAPESADGADNGMNKRN